jgi:hypothetical protein
MSERRGFLKSAGASIAGLAAFAVLAHRHFATTAQSVRSSPAGSGLSLTGDAERLNFALQLTLLEARFYRHAADSGLSDDALANAGRQGVVRHGRRMTFSDPEIGRHAQEFAADTAAQVRALRCQLGGAAVAQPAFGPTEGMRRAVSRPEEVVAALYPFSCDIVFLLAAYMIGNRNPAAHRMLLLGAEDQKVRATLARVLADAIYRQGVIGGLVATSAAADPVTEQAVASIQAMQNSLEGAGASDRSDGNVDFIDSQGQATAFLRTPGQIVKVLSIQAGLFRTGAFSP